MCTREEATLRTWRAWEGSSKPLLFTRTLNYALGTASVGETGVCSLFVLYTPAVGEGVSTKHTLPILKSLTTRACSTWWPAARAQLSTNASSQRSFPVALWKAHPSRQNTATDATCSPPTRAWTQISRSYPEGVSLTKTREVSSAEAHVSS